MTEKSYPPKLYPSRMDWNNPYEVTIGKRFDFDGGYYQRIIIEGVEQSLLIDTEKDPELDLGGYQVGDAVTIVRTKSGDDPWKWEVNGEKGQPVASTDSAGTAVTAAAKAPTSPLPSTHSRVAVSDVALIYLEHIEAIRWAHGKAGLGDVSNDTIATLAMTAMNKSMSDYSMLPKGHGEDKSDDKASDSASASASDSASASSASASDSDGNEYGDDLPF